MTLKANFELMADYNQWMNESIYAAAALMSVLDLNEDKGAFFGSVLGSLNHILVGDIIWLKRFSEHPAKLSSLEYIRGIESPSSLDVMLYTDLNELKSSRTEIDIAIREFTSEVDDRMLETSLKYKNTKGIPFESRFGALVHHFFNHQTHHRGQISTLLNQSGIDVGVTDLLVRIPN